MNITPIHELNSFEDGQPVMSIEGNVKYAGEVKHGKSNTGKDWSKQFFVLAQNGAEIGCTMWDAEGNALTKGETVNIENTQNKKGQWSGMTKGSYTSKDGEFKHSLEIRANQVKIKTVNGGDVTGGSDTGWGGDPPINGGEKHLEPTSAAAPTSKPESAATDPGAYLRDDPDRPAGAGTRPLDGVTEAKRHLVQSANLYNLCMDAVRTMVETHAVHFWPDGLGGEMFRTAVSSLYIEATRAGMLAKMPVKPL